MSSFIASGGAGGDYIIETTSSDFIMSLNTHGTGGGGDLTTAQLLTTHSHGMGGGAGYSKIEYITAVKARYAKKHIEITAVIEENITNLYNTICRESDVFVINYSPELEALFEYVLGPLKNPMYTSSLDDPELRYMTLAEEFCTVKKSKKSMFVVYSTKSGKFDEIARSTKAIQSVMSPIDRFIDVGFDILQVNGKLNSRDSSYFVSGLSGIHDTHEIVLDIFGVNVDAHDIPSNVFKRIRYLNNKIVETGQKGFQIFKFNSPIVAEVLNKFEQNVEIAGNILDAGRATGNFIGAIKYCTSNEKSASEILYEFLTKYIFLRFDAKSAGRKEAILADIGQFLSGEAYYISLLTGDVSTPDERAKRLLEEFSSMYRLHITKNIAPIVLAYYSLADDPALVAEPKVSADLQREISLLCKA